MIRSQTLYQKRFYIALSCALFGALIAIVLALVPHNADAVSTSGFNPGDIMSDAVMSNKSTLSESQITAFLKTKNPCNKSVSSEGSSVVEDSSTQAHWKTNSSIKYQIHGGKKGTTNGTFNCLANTTFGSETASHIIYQASQDYNINPQVMIVLLQKEQGLVTDTWPNSVQLGAATGYNCPDDDAGCRSTDAAFKKQVRGAAHMFNSILTKNPYWTNYYPVGTNYIQYNPSASCGGSNVNIQNLATSALYNYTPYQPNSAALAAGYGTAPCGAYGNRNFYLYFTDWFGSTHGYVKLLQARWMQLKNDAPKYNTAGQAVGKVWPKGLQVYFPTKTTIGDMQYLRTQHDTDGKIDLGFKYSDLKEIPLSYSPIKNPGWLESTRTTYKVDPITGKRMARIASGTQVFYVNQFTVGNKTYYQTQHDDSDGIPYSIPASDLKAANIAYQPFDKPRWMVAAVDTYQKDIRHTVNNIGSVIPAGTELHLDHKILVNGVWYTTKGVPNDPSTYVGIPLTDLSNISMKFDPMLTPRWLVTTQGIYKKDPETGNNVGDPFPKGTQIKFTSKIIIGDKTYLRTAHDTEKNIKVGFLWNELSETPDNFTPLQYETLLSPRKMKTTVNLNKKIPQTGEDTGSIIPAGTVFDFNTKVQVNGVWYLRTADDTSRGYNLGIVWPNDLTTL